MKAKLISTMNPPEGFPYYYFYFLPTIALMSGNGVIHLYIGWLFLMLIIESSEKENSLLEV